MVTRKVSLYKLAVASLENISMGDRNDAVAKMQRDLISAGYSLPRYGVDGYYWTETERAVKEFQSDAGVNTDGIMTPGLLSRIKTFNGKYTYKGRNIGPLASEIGVEPEFLEAVIEV